MIKQPTQIYVSVACRVGNFLGQKIIQQKME